MANYFSYSAMNAGKVQLWFNLVTTTRTRHGNLVFTASIDNRFMSITLAQELVLKLNILIKISTFLTI